MTSKRKTLQRGLEKYMKRDKLALNINTKHYRKQCTKLESSVSCLGFSDLQQ